MLKILTCLLLAWVILYVHGDHGGKGYQFQPRRPPHEIIPLPRPVIKRGCSGEFLCGTTGFGKNRHEECIHHRQVCDGEMDCFNGIDEENCPPRCALKGLIQCKDGHSCGKPCDGIQQCPQGDDEDNCPASCFCGDDSFVCISDGHCIHAKNRCDGQNDCLNGEDEEDCPVCCPEGQFQCRDGTCIKKSMVCDGTPHCEHHDDETDCPSSCRCHHGQYFCDRLPGMEQVCVNASQTCQGFFPRPETHCPLGDDELALGDWCSFPWWSES